MKQFNPLTRLYLLGIVLGLGLILTGFLMGGWKKLNHIAADYYQQETKELDSFSLLRIYAPIDIQVSDIDQPRLTYWKERKTGQETIVSELRNNVLSISQELPQSIISYKPLIQLAFSLTSPDQTEYDRALLELPKNMTLQELQAYINLGDIELSNLNINHLSLQVEDGNISLSHMNLGKTHLTNNLGNISLSDLSLDDGSIYLEDGDFIGKNLTFTGSNTIINNLGDVSLQLSDKSKKDLQVFTQVDLGLTSLPDTLSHTSPHSLHITLAAGDVTVE